MKEAQKAKDAASKRLHEAGQSYTELLGQVVPLRVEVADLKYAAKAFEAKMKKLEDQCVDRELKLGAAEAALEAKTKDFDTLEAEFAKLRAEMVKALAAKDQALVEALAAKDRELASQVEQSEKAEQELVNDVAGAFADGFAEALAQVACANPGIDFFGCSPLNEVVKGKIVPVEAPQH